jgi:serine/threonine-protein kinase
MELASAVRLLKPCLSMVGDSASSLEREERGGERYGGNRHPSAWPMGILDKLKTAFRSGRLDVDARFELLREAISGTMSNFYLARDRQTGQVVGLKICDSDKVEAFEARFRGLKKPAEGEIALTLKHPCIVETLECGITTKGHHYIVMEFLKGAGLHTRIHSRDPSLNGQRVELIRQMAEAIDYVHRAEFIHRDVCPRNFICSPDGASLKLIDFGLTLPAKKEYMQPGNRTGTPMYMAPEIVRRRWTDQRVDIFALGVTCYHLCTFELPWPVGESPAMSAMSHDTVAPTDIYQYCPRLNRTLGSAIMQCMAAGPNQRPQSAGDFLRLIRGVQRETDA